MVLILENCYMKKGTLGIWGTRLASLTDPKDQGNFLLGVQHREGSSLVLQEKPAFDRKKKSDTHSQLLRFKGPFRKTPSAS